MTTHVRTWIGAANGVLTDMQHAGKRGTRCRILRIRGDAGGWTDERKKAAAYWLAIYAALAKYVGVGLNDPINHAIDADFDEVAGLVKQIVAQAKSEGVSEWLVECYDDEIRGVDAPRPLLTADGPKVSASADESGVMLTDLVDQFNLPAMCTIRQSEQRAYELAAKVWDQVKAAAAAGATLHVVGNILQAAGCRLHYWCRMD